VKTVSLLALGILLTTTALAQQYTIKFATIAPDGGSWMNVMKEFDGAIRKESSGRLGFRFYTGGVQGDEKSVLRKIRIGQLQSAGFTGVGLGEIAPEVRILDSPFLLRNEKEVDFIYKEFGPEFEKEFEKGGFTLLGWAEVGFVYVFTNTPVKTSNDLKGLKMWTWEGDPVAESAFRTLGINPIPLSVTDVMTSLQTGLIDAFYTTPYAAIGLQWYTRAKYMVDVPLTNASGAVLISKSYFDKLPADLQEILKRNAGIYLPKLTEMIRKDNRDAVTELKKHGIQLLKANERDLQEYIQVGIKSRHALVGKLYSADLLNRVETAIANFRKSPQDAK